MFIPHNDIKTGSTVYNKRQIITGAGSFTPNHEFTVLDIDENGILYLKDNDGHVAIDISRAMVSVTKNVEDERFGR